MKIAGEIVESKSTNTTSDRESLSAIMCRAMTANIVGTTIIRCDTLHSGNYDPGGYSEFVRVPKINVEYGVYVLPDQVSYAKAP